MKVKVGLVLAQLEELVADTEAELRLLRRELRAWEGLAVNGVAEVGEDATYRLMTLAKNRVVNFGRKNAGEK